MLTPVIDAPGLVRDETGAILNNDSYNLSQYKEHRRRALESQKQMDKLINDVNVLTSELGEFKDAFHAFLANRENTKRVM